MIQVCDLILYFMVTVAPGVEESRQVFTNFAYAEKYLDENRYGRLVDVEAVERFECMKGPKHYSKRHGL